MQRKFYIPKNHDILDIRIIDNPFEILLLLKDRIVADEEMETKKAGVDYIILPLYSIRGGFKNVPERSGLNQWNANGRPRIYGEVYIPIPKKIHNFCPDFFPPREIAFNLITPNNEKLDVKVCQDNSKALMSKPNKALANWLLKIALGLKEREILTYERLENLGFDSVIIFKESNKNFRIDIRKIDSYEKFIENLESN